MKKWVLTFLILTFVFAFGSHNVNARSLRDQVIAALSAEIPNARSHFDTHPLATTINNTLLLDDNFLAATEAALGLTKQDKLYGGAAVVLKQGKVLVSVTSLPLEEGNWQQALAKFQDARFDRVSKHYAAQAAEADRQSLTRVHSFVHVYLGIKKSGQVVAAIGLCEASGEKQCFKPRQFPDSLQNSRENTISLKDLPPKRGDIDTKGELVLPGGGYLLSSEEVGKSQKYWDSLSSQARVHMRQVIKTDTSPWLVSEKHIDKFDIDKSKARQRAIQFWNKELERARR